MSAEKPKRIGILTAGGDCPGLNAAIRGVGKTAIVEYGMEIIGFTSGYTGLIEKEYVNLNESDLSGILTVGGTILGTSREKPFKFVKEGDEEKPELIKQNYHELGLDGLVCIGGNGTMKTAYRLFQEGLNIIGIPKTIDNDVWGTEVTFGFDSALMIANEASVSEYNDFFVVKLLGGERNFAGKRTGGVYGKKVALAGDYIALVFFERGLPWVEHHVKLVRIQVADRSVGVIDSVFNSWTLTGIELKTVYNQMMGAKDSKTELGRGSP